MTNECPAFGGNDAGHDNGAGKPYPGCCRHNAKMRQGSSEKGFDASDDRFPEESGPATAAFGVTTAYGPHAPMLHGAACGQHESAGNMYGFCLSH
jgi:hypothetical protein